LGKDKKEAEKREKEANKQNKSSQFNQRSLDESLNP